MMKKKSLVVILAGVLALSLTGCTVTVNEEETEKKTEKATEKTTEKATEKKTEKATEKSTELTAPSDTLEGTVNEVDDDGEAIVLKTDDGSEYTIFTTEATLNLDSNGLEDGIYVSVTLQSTTATDGSFTATEIDEIDDPNSTSSTESQTQAQSQSESQSESQTSSSSGGLVATSTDLTGYIYGADGSTLTLDGDDGNTYPIYYADASVEDTDDGLVDGSYCAITIADVNPSADGNFTALDVEQLADPDEGAGGTTEAQTSSSSGGLVATSTDLTGYIYGADGSTLTLEGDDGNEYPIYYADASVEDTDDGLVDGSYCAITIADVNPSADGNFTALDVEQLADPDESA